MELAAPCPSLLKQSIGSIDWRIDVLVGASHTVQRIGSPTIVLSLTLAPSGVTLTFRLTQADLHQWRFVMAKAVRDLAYLEKKRPPTNAARKRKF